MATYEAETNYLNLKLSGDNLHIKVQFTMKAYRESRGIAPLILHLGVRWRWVVNMTPSESTPVPTLNRRRLGGHQSRSARFGSENYL